MKHIKPYTKPINAYVKNTCANLYKTYKQAYERKQPQDAQGGAPHGKQPRHNKAARHTESSRATTTLRATRKATAPQQRCAPQQDKMRATRKSHGANAMDCGSAQREL